MVKIPDSEILAQPISTTTSTMTTIVDTINSGTFDMRAVPSGTLNITNTSSIPVFNLGGKAEITAGTGTIDSNVMALWHFNELAGSSTALDFYKRNHDGTVLATGSGTASFVPGRFGNAISFISPTLNNFGYVSIPSSTDFDLSGQFTLESQTFISPSSTFASSYFLTRTPVSVAGSGNGTKYMQLGITANRNFTFTIGVLGVAADVLISASTLLTNRWYHLAITRNSSNVVNMFVDGIPDINSLTTTRDLVGANRTVSIGADANINNGGAFTGTIDEVRWSNTARSYFNTETEYGFKPTPMDVAIYGFDSNTWQRYSVDTSGRTILASSSTINIGGTSSTINITPSGTQGVSIQAFPFTSGTVNLPNTSSITFSNTSGTVNLPNTSSITFANIGGTLTALPSGTQDVRIAQFPFIGGTVAIGGMFGSATAGTITTRYWGAGSNYNTLLGGANASTLLFTTTSATIFITDVVVSASTHQGTSGFSLHNTNTSTILGPMFFATSGGMVSNFVTPLAVNSGTLRAGNSSGTVTLAINYYTGS